MGTDIHCHIEVKTKDGRWHHWGAPALERDYDLFFRMAGVRGPRPGVRPIAQPRGLPADLTEVTRTALEHDRGYDHSFMSGEEMEDLIDEWMAREETWARGPSKRGGFGYLFGNGYSVVRYPPRHPYIDCRLVFWFDS